MKPLIVVVACMACMANATSRSAWPQEALSSTSTPAPTAGLDKTSSPEVVATEQDQVLLLLHVYRVRGNISGETSLTSGLSGSDGKELGAIERPFSFWNTAKLTVAGIEFRADESGWTWDGKDRPPSGKGVQMIASPSVVLQLNNSFTVGIGSAQPVEYFEKRPDGLFELKKLNEETGLTLSATVAQGTSERILLRDFTVRLRSIERREPIEGVSLDVGRPNVRAREDRITICIEPDRDYGIEVMTEGYGFLMIRLRVRLAKPGELEQSAIPGDSE